MTEEEKKSRGRNKLSGIDSGWVGTRKDMILVQGYISELWKPWNVIVFPYQ